MNRRGEETLRRAHDELAHRVEERTRELAATNHRLREESAQRQRAAIEAATSEARLRAVLEASLDPLVTIDGYGTIQSASSSVERVFGWKPKELIGRNIRLLMPEPYRSEHDEYLAAHRRHGTTKILGVTREFRAQRKDGASFPCELSVSKVDLPDGEGILFAGTIRDISERVKVEESLRLAHDDLEQRVEERTAEVSRAFEQLKDEMAARQKAEEHSRQQQAQLAHVSRLSSLGEMAAGLAHELNQPLSAIANYTHVCTLAIRPDEGGSKRVADLLTQISSEAERAGRIIRRLRDLAHKRTPNQSAVNINDVLEEVAALVAPEARLHDVWLQFEMDPGMPAVLADPILLQQAIMNLVRNAIEATSESDVGPHEVIVRASRSGSGMIEVSVRDTGVGVAPDVLDRLFEPFFTTKAEGLGIGLTITRSIIESFGGRLEAGLNPDRDMTFHIVLPCHEGDERDGR